MDTWLPALINGVALGGLYAMFALSVVVLHRAASLVNFAHGNVAMLLAFIAFELTRRLGFAPWQAVLACVPVAAVMAVVIHGAVIMPRRSSDELNTLFRTLALMLLLFAVAQRIWGAHEPYEFPSLFGAGSVAIADYRVTYLQFGALGLAIVLSVGFGLLVARTRWGLMMLATSSNRATASLLGVRVQAVEITAWIIAGVLLLIIGVMFASFYSLYSDVMSGVLLKGFTAAILGGLNSFPGALAGGLLVGIIDAELAAYANPEWQAIVVFAILVAVLMLRPAGLFGTRSIERV